MFTNLDKILDEIIEIGVPGSDCIVMQDGEVVYRKQRGYSDPANKIPMKGNEIVNTYSCTKFFTAVAAMQLWEKGLFKLDQPICDFMPEFTEMRVGTPDDNRPADKKITFRHLLTMTAGLGYATDTPGLLRAIERTEGRCGTVDMMRGIAEDCLNFDPGTHWMYSLCLDVMGALIEVISGKRFGLYLKENIFDVVGMPNTTMMMSAADSEKIKAPQFVYDAANKRSIQIMYDIAPIAVNRPSLKFGELYESGGAGATSCTDDYIKFLEEIRTGERLLKRETIDLMKTNQLSGVPMEDFWMKEGYGYGLGIRCPKGVPHHNDYGWGGAAGAYMGIDPELNMTFYYSQHVLGSVETLKHKIYSAIRRDLTGESDIIADLPEGAHA